MIVESGSGAVQWDLKLNSRAESPGPATLSTADHRSTFLIWGEYQVAGNETVSSAAEWLLFPRLWARTVWSYAFFPVFPFISLCATNAAASCTECGVADQCGLLEAGRPLRVICVLTMSIAMSLLAAGGGTSSFCHPQADYVEKIDFVAL